MTYTAYLVLWVDTTRTPPAIIDAGIYSEETPTTSSFTKRKAIPIGAVQSEVSYERARYALLQKYNGLEWGWLQPLLHKF